jgi:hypothetical protein
MPWIVPQYFVVPALGSPKVMAAFYQLFSYQQNTTTKQDTFADSDMTTANTNPIVLDEFGRAPIFLSLNNYKFVLATPTASDPPAPGEIIWTEDYVPAYGTLFANFDISGIAGEDTDTDHNVVYLSDGSDGKIAGRWYLTNALNDFSSSHAITLGVAVAPILEGETGVIRIAGRAEHFTASNLTPGAVYYLSDADDGRVVSTPPAQNVMILGKADSISTMLIEPAWGNTDATTRGMVYASAQTFGGLKTFNSQAKTNIGAAATLPATIGGGLFTDVVEHTVPASSTKATMTATTIPADMLNANGKAVALRFGSSTASTGGVSSLFLRVGSTDIAGPSGTNATPAYARAVIVRIDSDSVDVGVMTAVDFAFVTVSNVTRINGLDFTSAIDIKTLATTAAASTVSQTYFTMWAR